MEISTSGKKTFLDFNEKGRTGKQKRTEFSTKQDRDNKIETRKTKEDNEDRYQIEVHQKKMNMKDCEKK